MSIAVSQRAVPATSADVLVLRQVRALLQSSLADPAQLERRRDRRYPFPLLMTLYPAQGETAPAPQVIVGKDISERGLGFFHQQPILFRRAIVVCDAPGAAQVAFLVDISWCRFARQGWYESGCRLLEAVVPPTGGQEAAAT